MTGTARPTWLFLALVAFLALDLVRCTVARADEVSPVQPWGPDLTKTSRVVILGAPHTGKTTTIERITADAWRVVWFSPAWDDFDRPGRLVLSVRELERWPVLLRDEHARIVVRPEGDAPDELADEVRRLTRLVSAAKNLIVVFDEVGDYKGIPDADKALTRLFRRGRHDGVATILSSQVPTDIPKTCRRIASHVYCTLLERRAELAELSGDFGDDFAARVAAWTPYQAPALWRSRGLT